MAPEKRDKILDILSECSDTINEGMSFETTFSQETHPAIQTEAKNMKDQLSGLYFDALRLSAAIRSRCSEIQKAWKEGQPISGTDKVSDWLKTRGKCYRYNISDIGVGLT